MMNFKQLLLHDNARPFIDQARFGIERDQPAVLPVLYQIELGR